jgi:ABC-type nitrate/sulfonate/bicarbonate transport system substrate-binding protein
MFDRLVSFLLAVDDNGRAQRWSSVPWCQTARTRSVKASRWSIDWHKQGATGDECSAWRGLIMRQSYRPGPSIRIVLTVVTAIVVLAACGGADEAADAGTAAGADSSAAAGDVAEEDLPIVKIHAFEGGTSAAATRVIEMNGCDIENGFRGEYFEVSGDASVQFLLQGESDVSFDGDPVTAALLRSQGNEISTFYPLVVQDATMVVRGDAAYENVNDLVGQNVGHDGLESGTMTAAQIMLNEFEDISIEEDFDLQLTEEAALIRLVERGDLEATFLGQPEVLIAEMDFGLKPVWGPAWEVWRDERGGAAWNITLMAYESWLRENPELARAVTAAWDCAYEWIKEDTSRLTEDPFPELLGIDNPEVLEAFAQLVDETDYFTNSWTEEDAEAARAFIEFAADEGTIIQEAPEGSVVRLEDLEE